MKGIVVAFNPIRGMAAVETQSNGYLVLESLGYEMERGDVISQIPFEHEGCTVYNETQMEHQDVYIQALGATLQNAMNLIR